jgi:hypothetical protein
MLSHKPFLLLLLLLLFRNVADPNFLLLFLTLRFRGCNASLVLMGGVLRSSLAGDGKQELKKSNSLFMSL